MLRLLVASVSAVVVAMGVVGLSSASAATVPVWPAASAYTAVPSNAASGGNGNAAFDQISCTSRGNCSGAGYFYDTSHHEQAMVATESGGVWGPATQLSLPGGVSSTSDYLESVSCTGPGNCVAGGSYRETGGSSQAMVAAESNGSWGQAAELTPPSDAITPSSQQAAAYSVSCTAPGDCVAAGWYLNTSDNYEGMVATESNGVWGQATRVAEPGNTASSYGWLASVACSSTGNCVAGGQYQSTGGGDHAMIVTETAGSWGQANELSLPSAASEPTTYGDVPYAISCPSAGNCTAAGQYEDPAGNVQPMVAAETNGVWGQGNAVSLPSNATTTAGAQFGDVYGLSCTSVGNCTLGGYYTDTNNDSQPMVATQSNGVWGQAQQLGKPSNASTATSSDAGEVYTVSCTSPGYCEASGYYVDTNGDSDAFIAKSVGSLSVTGGSLPSAALGVRYSAQLPAMGGAPSYSWSLLSGALPAGLSLNPATGVISGTARSLGSSTFNVSVSDPGPPAQQASGTVSITVGKSPTVTKVVRFGNQKLTLTTIASVACVIKGQKLAVKFNSVRRAKGAKLRFVRALVFVDKGVKHRVHRRVHGKRKLVIVYVANATKKHLPVALNLSTAGLKSGRHTLRLVVYYKKTFSKHGHKQTSLVHKTLLVNFRVC